MKYKTKIISRGNKFVGELLQDGQVVYTTPELDDPIIVSRSLATYLAQLTPPPVMPAISSPAEPRAPISTTITRDYLPAERTPARRAYPPSTRKCCGRS